VIKPVDVFSIETSRKWRQLLVSSSLVKTIFLVSLDRQIHSVFDADPAFCCYPLACQNTMLAC